MRKLSKNKYLLPVIFAGLLLSNQRSNAQEDSVEAVPVIKLHYFNNNNSLQYLILESMLKKGKVLTPQKNKSYTLYLDSSNAENLLAALTTNEQGKAKAFIPTSAKALWDASPQHTFIVRESEAEVITDYSITKSKMEIDTSSSDGVKSITVIVKKLENEEWVPAPEVEMRIGVHRLGGILSAGDDATYTTDSSGSITVEFAKDSLPGDEKGNITLAARIDDNEFFGNLLTEKIVPWGVATKTDHSFFDKRTLWTTRLRTPFWLLFLAYSIILSVWGTLIYLVIQLFKIKKLGKVSLE